MTGTPGAGGPSAFAGGPSAHDGADGGEPRLIIRDKRRLDPETGALRAPTAGAPTAAGHGGQKERNMADDIRDQGGDAYEGRHTRPGEGDSGDATSVPGVPGGWPAGDAEPAAPPTSPAGSPAAEAAARAAYEGAPKGSDPAPASTPAAPAATDDDHPDTALAAERLLDLQRLQAEYVNYKKRVDRDRDVERHRAISGVIESLLPVLDEIHLARQHGELETGPFAKIAEKLEGILARYGVERYGQPGETFDPMIHEAVMHTQAELAPGTTETTVVQVMQPGYRMNGKVVRAALVAVADPQ